MYQIKQRRQRSIVSVKRYIKTPDAKGHCRMVLVSKHRQFAFLCHLEMEGRKKNSRQLEKGVRIDENCFGALSNIFSGGWSLHVGSREGFSL